VVPHPTETCYGLAADIFNEKAVSKVYQMKAMSKSKPVSIMVSSLEEAQKYGVFDKRALVLAEKYWPGPLTIIVPRTERLPSHINEGMGTVGLRCPDHPLVFQMLRMFGGPLVTTSANRTGELQAYGAGEFLRDRQEDCVGAEALPDAIIDIGRIPEVSPSTIVECTEAGCKVLRQGPIRLDL